MGEEAGWARPGSRGAAPPLPDLRVSWVVGTCGQALNADPSCASSPRAEARFADEETEAQSPASLPRLGPLVHAKTAHPCLCVLNCCVDSPW